MLNSEDILQKYFAQAGGKQIIAHQIESFNQFIEYDIPDIIHRANPIRIRGSPETPIGLSRMLANSASMTVDSTGAAPESGARHEYELTMEFMDVHMRKPTIFENNGAILPMMPNDARLRTLTYAAPLHVDVKVTAKFIDNTQGGLEEIRTRIFPNVHLGKIPVMVGSKYCLLADQTHVHPSQMSECASDMGGYFIIQGGERIIISQERMCENRPFIFRNNKNPTKEIEVVEIKSIGPDNDQAPKTNTVKLMYHPKNSQIHLLRAVIPRIKADIPLVILFRALGVLPDKDIYDMIVGDDESAFDSIMLDSMEEAAAVTTKEAAYEWLGQNVVTWTPKANKMLTVADILTNDLFPHMGGVGTEYEKACFLANMTKKMIWTMSKRIPMDDRDGYSNKRVDLPGFLMASLFRSYFTNKMVKDIRSSLSKEIHNGAWKTSQAFEDIVNISNIHKIIKSTIMDVGMKTSLATGNFSGSKMGNASKVGISQVMNRLNFAAGISHLRRVSTPIEKTAGKLLEPRKLHNSQYGYVCVTKDTNILNGNGMTSTAIMNMKNGDNVLTADPFTLEESASEIHNYFQITPSRVIKIKTLSGRTIGCSPDHPILVVRDTEHEWIHAGDLKVGDKVVVKNYTVPLPTNDGSHSLVLSSAHIKDIDVSLKRYAELESYIDCEISEEKKHILARLLGASLTDGTLTECTYGFNSNFYVGEESDAKSIIEDIKSLGFGSTNYRRKTSVYTKEDKTVTYNYYDVSKGGAFATLLVALGGKKGKYSTPRLPVWIENGSSTVKREFLSGFQGGDGCRIRGEDSTSKLQIGRTQQTCSTEYAGAHYSYMTSIAKLFTDLGVDATLTDETHDDKTIHFINISSSVDNICKYATTIGYRYCAEKVRESALNIEYANYKNMLHKEKHEIVNEVRELRDGGMTLSEFANQVTKMDDKIVMPIIEIADIPVEDVYDFTTRSDNHDFYANGILVRNCPCETPEGAGVGVVKNMSSTSHVAIWTSPVRIHKFLSETDGFMELSKVAPLDMHKNIRCFVNGRLAGIIMADAVLKVVDDIRKAKRCGRIHIFTAILWKSKLRELIISTEAGRIIRPVYYAPALREAAAAPELLAQIKSCKSWDDLLMWESPSGKHLIEYIDPGESDGVYIAMTPEKALEDTSTTHAEIHPSAALGTTASFIPFPDHNQSPRNAYQSSMGKQAMGVYALNYRERFDAQAHVLCYPQKPLVTPFLSRVYGINDMPAGQNIIVAIMTYSGYNQEDSVMINRASLERGLFRSIFYRTYKDEEKKNQSSGEEEKFCKPDPELTKHLKFANYEKLDASGFVPENTYVTSHDILIGKTVPIRVATGQILPAGTKKFKDVSKTLRNNEVGYVDRIFTSRNGEGYSFTKIRVRQDRIPEIGDKFSCYSDDTEVLTTKGWINFPELIGKDREAYKVAALTEDGKLKYVIPDEVMSYDFDGNMYAIKNNQIDLLVTPNHRMYVADRQGKQYGFELAEDIYGKRRKYMKNVSGVVLHDEKHTLLTYDDDGIPCGFIMNDRILPINEWLAFFGIWIAEGCTDGKWAVVFAAHKQRVKDELERVCAVMNLKINKQKDGSGDEIRNCWCIPDKSFVKYIAPLSVGAVNKSLPDWVWHLTVEQCKILINGLLLGDGHTMKNGTRRYDTSSKQLADDFQRLCLHAGYSTNIAIKCKAGYTAVCKAIGREGEKFTTTTDAYRLTIIESQNNPIVNKNMKLTGENQQDQWIQYKGKVYCCRVEGPGAIYVRRKDSKIPVWCGNSRHGELLP
jgi:DNA-directed RNA polymerase beta subunit/intein/homing endonuclease